MGKFKAAGAGAILLWVSIAERIWHLIEKISKKKKKDKGEEKEK